MHMFSSLPRCCYRKNQLTDVICQFRFPRIPELNDQEPQQYREAIRDLFPQYHLRQDIPAPKITGAPGNFSLENQPRTVNHQFTSACGRIRVNLTSNFISVSCANYTCWEDFAAMLDKPLAEFIRMYQPTHFLRIGLRYLNVISRRDLDMEGIRFSELLQPCYLGPLGEPDISQSATTRCTLDLETAMPGGCRLKIHAGPGHIRKAGIEDPEAKFVFDQDLSITGNLPLNHTAATLQTLHSHAWSVFRGAITQKLHAAMEPANRNNLY